MMDFALVVLLAAVVVLLARDQWPAKPKYVALKREVVVTTANDRSVRGVLVDEDGHHLWLADARYLHEAQEHEAAGMIRVPKSNEEYTQVLDA